jgi:hypothetical protein
MRVLLSLALLLAPAAACVDDDPAEPAPPAVTSGAYHHYAQTAWNLPTSSTDARGFGFDLDDDGDVENQAGAVIGALIGIGLDVEGANLDAFDRGAVVALYSVRADSLARDASVSWRVLNGISPGAPRFDGTDTYFPTSDEGLLSGAIRDGVLSARHGTVTIRLPVFPDQPALAMPLVDARVERTPDGACRGRVGGAIPQDALDGTILPQLGEQAVIHMARNPDHEFTRLATDIFDDDGDGVATAGEIARSELTHGLFRLDLDRDGDDVDDAVSIALEFFCVPAIFDATAE